MKGERAALMCVIATLTACDDISSDASRAYAATSVISCLQAFADVTGSLLNPSGDRAQVLLYRNYVGVSIMEGELGTFGVRSPNYHQFLACYETRGPDKAVQFMYVQDQNVLVGSWETYNQITEEIEGEFIRGEVTEFLFLRRNGEYVFEAMQQADEENFYKHNPVP